MMIKYTTTAAATATTIQPVLMSPLILSDGAVPSDTLPAQQCNIAAGCVA
jgi:hypothetical protein